MNNHPIISKPHLRVSVPVTTNGILLKYDSAGQPSFQTKYLPLSAEKRLVQRNRRLPEHLRLKFERVDPTIKNLVDTGETISFDMQKVPSPQDGAIQTLQSEPVKNKGGRPPKAKQTLDNE